MAARAIEARKALDLEVRLGVAEALAGRAAPRPARSGEGLSALNEHTARLAGLKGQIDTHRGDEHAEKLKLAHELFAQVQKDGEVPVPGSELDEKYEAMKSILGVAAKQCSELECAICFDTLTEEDMFLGSRCYHLFHAKCVLGHARMHAPQMGDHTIQQMNPNGGGPMFDELGARMWNPLKGTSATDGEFPACGTMKCPMCNDAAFCDKQHFQLNEQARAEVLSGNVADVGAAGPDGALEEARKKNHVYLLEVESDPTLIMAVEAKVPYDPKHRARPHGYVNGDFCGMWEFSHSLRACTPPFRFDFSGDICGGKAWYRPKQAPDPDAEHPSTLPDHDEMPEGAKIAHTKKVGGNEGGALKLELPYTMLPPPAPKARKKPEEESDTGDEEEQPLLKRRRKAPAAAGAGPVNEGVESGSDSD